MHSKHIIGLPVVHIDLGRHCGVVQGVVLSSHPQGVTGFVIGLPGWRKRGLLAMQHVHAIGSQAVTIEAHDAIQTGDTTSELYGSWRQGLDLHGMPVLTAHGRGLGRVQCFRFAMDGSITALDVQLTAGNRRKQDVVTIDGDSIRAFGEDAVVIHSDWTPSPPTDTNDSASVPATNEPDTGPRVTITPWKWPWRTKPRPSPENESAVGSNEIKEDIQDDPTSVPATIAVTDDGPKKTDDM